MKNLLYKGIVFDEYTQDEYGTWGEICEACVEKHKDKIQADLDDGGACGCCSVKGCTNTGASEKKHYYIDFAPQNITYLPNDGDGGVE